MLLSTHNDSRFCRPCTHGCVNGDPAPKTVESFAQRTEDRKATKEDWNGVCLVCNNDKVKGKVVKCTHCKQVAHQSCVKRAHWDVDKANPPLSPRVCGGAAFVRDQADVPHVPR